MFYRKSIMALKLSCNICSSSNVSHMCEPCNNYLCEEHYQSHSKQKRCHRCNATKCALFLVEENSITNCSDCHFVNKFDEMLKNISCFRNEVQYYKNAVEDSSNPYTQEQFDKNIKSL